jgi:hypothetical protein
MFDDFPAKNAVCKPYIYVVLANLAHEPTAYNIFTALCQEMCNPNIKENAWQDVVCYLAGHWARGAWQSFLSGKECSTLLVLEAIKQDRPRVFLEHARPVLLLHLWCHCNWYECVCVHNFNVTITDTSVTILILILVSLLLIWVSLLLILIWVSLLLIRVS